jgi:hypothetical protein
MAPRLEMAVEIASITLIGDQPRDRSACASA